MNENKKLQSFSDLFVDGSACLIQNNIMISAKNKGETNCK